MDQAEKMRITYPSNGAQTPGVLALPSGEARSIGLVVIQEWWGLVPHIEQVAVRLAQAGFVALAPDLYHGAQASEPDEARKLAMALDRDRAVGEILAATEYLRAHDRVRGDRIGVVGWCMGGALALSSAAENGSIGAVVVYYGRPLAAEDTPKLQAPVLGLYGELDAGIPVSAVREFEAQLVEHEIEHEIHIYAGAHHAFFNDTRLEAYHP